MLGALSQDFVGMIAGHLDELRVDVLDAAVDSRDQGRCRALLDGEGELPDVFFGADPFGDVEGNGDHQVDFARFEFQRRFGGQQKALVSFLSVR